MGIKDITNRARSAMVSAQQAAALAQSAKESSGEAKSDGLGNGDKSGKASMGRAALTSPGASAFYGPVIEEAVSKAEKAQARVEQLQQELAQRTDELDVEQIVENPGRRRKLDAQEYQELRENLMRNELVHPVVVRPAEEKLPDGRPMFELISGGNRLAIFRELGRNKIPARVMTLDKHHAAEAAFWANLIQPSLSDYERFKGFEQIRAARGMSAKELSALSGIDSGTVARVLAFARLPASVHSLLEKHPRAIGSRAMYALLEIYEEDKDAREAGLAELISQLCEGSMTQDEAVARAKKTSLLSKQAEPPSRSVVANTVHIRAGRSVFCKIVSRGRSVRLEFTSEDLCASSLDQVESLLKELAQKSRSTGQE